MEACIVARSQFERRLAGRNVLVGKVNARFAATLLAAPLLYFCVDCELVCLPRAGEDLATGWEEAASLVGPTDCARTATQPLR